MAEAEKVRTAVKREAIGAARSWAAAIGWNLLRAFILDVRWIGAVLCVCDKLQKIKVQFRNQKQETLNKQERPSEATAGSSSAVSRTKPIYRGPG